jgi:hypothetical protein
MDVAEMDWQADYDSPWKEIIEQFFPEFMAFSGYVRGEQTDEIYHYD